MLTKKTMFYSVEEFIEIEAWLLLIFFSVALFSCFTISMLQVFRVALSLCFPFFILLSFFMLHSFRVALFLCYTIFMLFFIRVLLSSYCLFCVAHFSCGTISVLHTFHVALPYVKFFQDRLSAQKTLVHLRQSGTLALRAFWIRGTLFSRLHPDVCFFCKHAIVRKESKLKSNVIDVLLLASKPMIIFSTLSKFSLNNTHKEGCVLISRRTYCNRRLLLIFSYVYTIN